MAPVGMIDLSELMRPEALHISRTKEMVDGSPDLMGSDHFRRRFRDYTVDLADPLKEQVRRTYHQMHRNQTVQFVKDKHRDWLSFSHFRADVRSALEGLNAVVDESDPDTSLPNIVHAFQTAERIRAEHPEEDWFALTGLIHDLGKVLALHGEPQWAVVGDTFVVGCRWPQNIVYRETSFQDNPDAQNEKYNTKYGMYEPNCGLDRVTMSWGHDEYLYQVLRHNGARLPDEALYTIRYHSFYPWHSANEYSHLTSSLDERMKPWILEFNKYDLYTKTETVPDIEALWPYYQGLIDKYIPGILSW